MEDIILASSSPRRKEILNKYNIKHISYKSNIVEKINSDDKPEVVAMGLAFQKSLDIANDFPNKIIIGADTIVVYKNEILGKPKNKDDAIRILSLLNGNTHKVITGISLIQTNQGIKVVSYESTKVRFRQMDIEFIRKYVETGEPFDKAGAYGIQDYGGLLVEAIDGSYLNVVGLPLVKLDKLLIKYFKKYIL